MGRTLSANVLSELSSATVRLALLAEIEFTATTLRLTTFPRDLSWDSKTWLGNGWFEGIESVEESGDLRANNLRIFLTGVGDTVNALILAQSARRSSSSVWLAFLNASEAVVADPVLLFTGTVDVPEIEDDWNQSRATIACENALVALSREKQIRWSHQAQQGLFAGDRGFEYVENIARWSGFWGRSERPPRPRSI